MPKVTSSNIRSIEYADGSLLVTFCSGSTYKYTDVPHEAFQSLLDADADSHRSVGKEFNLSVKNHFPFQRVP